MSKYNTHPATSMGNWKMKNVRNSKEIAFLVLIIRNNGGWPRNSERNGGSE